jgi:hypothetical protein
MMEANVMQSNASLAAGAEYDGGGNVSDSTVMSTFSYVFEGVLLTAVTVFGLVANTIAVIVLIR